MRAQPPDEAAFHDAVRRAGDGWYAACLRITGSPAEAQDAVQDGLLKAWDRRAQFQGNARLETWIHRITVNSALALLRKRKPVVDSAAVPELPADDPGPAEALGASELGDALRRALQPLSPMERSCFVLKHLEQWRLAEIAAEMEIGIGPVKQALFRAVRKLRAELPHPRSEP